ncbi:MULTISPECIES: flagellin [Vibrio]|jgi:flagellin|uniref:Flagellin n=2 Tax=Vibrio alginolyticus TaxID=663 RepID=A0A0H0YAD5_VIBAL|nr:MULTISPECIES: flagellin [Vibrio]EEZ84018.1 Flagellin B [Vibrio alginolyticus 40B]MDG2786638.1 flagellin [Vibrio parahaemolyticus]MDW1810757.1 flagellin [Vibrio sp. Vb2362]MDW1970418.1 flagellin [Vibrio sp. 945]MDW2259104.1 flagellin [Vibrio sp. 1409]MDW2294854.1 flagellin [Vibrio sp. 1404]NAW55139.1 flagellin [Vibrio sp. V41_P2S12T139]NAW95890.1 flagellin [Vibrio sp. V42_P2S4T144]QCO86801.1 flagellin [Vibrio neocaledonicus]QIR89260.1 flagellin [Vibrio diabolicus]GAJ74050.1 flagellin p
MAINVNTNVSAMTAQRYLNQAADGQQKSMERLSSGYKINSAKDDAAGLQISNRLNAQSRGLDMAVKNANDGISIAQVAEGAMNESTNILQRMRDLSLQSANGSNSKAERVAIQEEVTALNDELNRIAETTSFGGNKLLNGTYGTQSFQIGADSGEAVMLSMGNLRSDTSAMGGKSYAAEEGKDASWTVGEKTEFKMSYTNKQGEEKELSISAKQGDDIEQLATYINGQNDDVKASVGEDGKLQVFASSQKVEGDVEFSGNLADEIGFGGPKDVTVKDIDVTTVAGSQEAVAVIDGALKSVDSQRASLGAFQNRFNHAISNLDNINENVNASKSRIKDTDYAKETTAMTKSQILQQASTSILAQAKQSPSAALSLLG